MRKLHAMWNLTSIKRKDRVRNVDVLEIASHVWSNFCLANRCLRRAGHVARMDDETLPKTIILFSQLKHGHRSKGRPRLRLCNILKRNITLRNIDHNTWYKTGQHGELWKAATDNNEEGEAVEVITMAIE